MVGTGAEKRDRYDTHCVPLFLQGELPFTELEVAASEQARQLLQFAVPDGFSARGRARLDISCKLGREVAQVVERSLLLALRPVALGLLNTGSPNVSGTGMYFCAGHMAASSPGSRMANRCIPT